MKLSDLIVQARKVLAEFGDMDVIAASDAEGNGYESTRGLSSVFIDPQERQIEFVYDSEEEAAEYCTTTQRVVLVYL